MANRQFSLKRIIIGTRFGRLSFSARESFGMVAACLARSEVLGTLANDHLAGTITARLCRDGKIFVDIGAHLGSMVNMVSHWCPNSKIVAFEPIPDKLEHLRRKFPGIECHGCALGDSECEASFFVNLKESGCSSLGRHSWANGPGSAEIKVPLKKLDSIIDSIDVEVIKIDVEGAELGVLAGGERLIDRSRPVIMFESGPPADDGLGYTKDSVWRWFDDRNYAVLIPNRVAHIDPGLGQGSFVESHLYPRRTTNYFAVPKERRAEVRDRVRSILKLSRG